MKGSDDIYNKVCEQLSKTGEAMIPAFDNSAWPFARMGKDCVLLHTVEELLVGDLVFVYECTGRCRLMRVLEIQALCLLLNCDGSLQKPLYYLPSEVKAVVQCVIRSNGKQRQAHINNLKQTAFDCIKPLVLLFEPDDHRNVYLY